MRGYPVFLTLAAGILALGACSPSVPEVTVEMSEFSFEPKAVAVQPGAKTVVVLRNKGTTDHNFTVADLKVASANVAAGSTARVEVAGPARVYRLVCTIHEDAGMVGEVRIQRR